MPSTQSANKLNLHPRKACFLSLHFSLVKNNHPTNIPWPVSNRCHQVIDRPRNDAMSRRSTAVNSVDGRRGTSFEDNHWKIRNLTVRQLNNPHSLDREDLRRVGVAIFQITSHLLRPHFCFFTGSCFIASRNNPSLYSAVFLGAIVSKNQPKGTIAHEWKQQKKGNGFRKQT